ncbi:MAG: arylamine N-acetyltransferase [Candidatus Methylacidiphilales bacterium]|nr:arylamine N-acetyltransferase [Candidatus Methylacidiphilales bacterium]
MPHKPDLDAYFKRIGYTGSREPTLETLNDLLMAHVTTVPFENLDVLLGRGICIEAAVVEKKLVVEHRGGYCFEQNGHFIRVLEALGYKVKSISARVRWKSTRDVTPARTHLFSRVELDGQWWLADVGVGGLSLTSALLLKEMQEQATPHDTRRIIRESVVPGAEPSYFHQVLIGSTWMDVCEFTLEEMPEIDREVGNWFTSTHPTSKFRNHLLLALAARDGSRLTVLDNVFTSREPGGQSVKFTVRTPEELLELLAEHFALSLPAGTRIWWPGAPWEK